MINLANHFLRARNLYQSDLEDVQRLAQSVASKYENVDVSYEGKTQASKGSVEAHISSPEYIRVETDRQDLLITREEAENLRDVLTVLCSL